MIDVVALTSALVAAASVTPARGAVFDVLASALMAQGFSVDRFVSGDAPDGPVENLLATRGEDDGPHLAFAGHLDVVPAGAGWTSPPFEPAIRDGALHGRGAVDMKGAIAAFAAAAARDPDHRGRMTLIITGDEEGPATHGTVALIARMAARGLTPDFCLVGEPTSQSRLGDTIKVGRRGSVNITIEVPGTQGHVAYPQLADNPLPRLVALLAEIAALRLDDGTDWFEPSNIELTTIDTGNTATNVIPGSACARLSIRFNDRHRGHDLVARIEAIVRRHSDRAIVAARVSGEAFLTLPGALSTLVGDAVHAVTGVTPALSTSGGTSDARFLVALCPTVEFGLPNATMHKLDEGVALVDLAALVDVYAAVIARVYA